MPDRTGIARGSLRPVIYYQRSDGYVVLAPSEIGSEVDYAKMMYQRQYEPQGWAWREADTLAAVDELQKRLVEQEVKRNEHMAAVNDRYREETFKQTGSALRARMISAETTPFERDFIAHYLQLRDEKRNKYRDALTHHNMYIWAREQDAGTKVEDKLPLQPGQFER